MKGCCLSRESAPISRYLRIVFAFGTGQDFLKSRVVSERIRFPTCPQVGKGDAAVIGVVHAYNRRAA